MYDPVIGRFLSADPTIPGSLGSQATNRYAYVGNNPLTLTDSSGFEPDELETVTIEGSRGQSPGSGGPSVENTAAARAAAAEVEAQAAIERAPLTAQPLLPGDLNMTLPEYLDAVKKGLWRNAPVMKKGFANNREVNQATRETNKRPATSKGDVEASRGVWEIGRQNGQYVYRDDSADPLGPWQPLPGAQ